MTTPITENPTAARGTTTLEIAVYTVKDPAGFPAIRAAAREELSQSAAGLLAWQPLSPLSPELQQQLPAEMHAPATHDASICFADLVAWKSLEAARTAGERVAQADEFAEFRAAIADIQHFAHYRALAPADEIAELHTRARLIEIAAYDVQDPAVHASAQELLYQRRLPDQSGWQGGARLQHCGELNGMGDLLGWENLAAWQATGAKMQSDPELAPFFNGLVQTHVFALFTLCQHAAGREAQAR